MQVRRQPTAPLRNGRRSRLTIRMIGLVIYKILLNNWSTIDTEVNQVVRIKPLVEKPALY